MCVSKNNSFHPLHKNFRAHLWCIDKKQTRMGVILFYNDTEPTPNPQNEDALRGFGVRPREKHFK